MWFRWAIRSYLWVHLNCILFFFTREIQNLRSYAKSNRIKDVLKEDLVLVWSGSHQNIPSSFPPQTPALKMLRQTACFHLPNGTEMKQIGTFGAPCPYAERWGGVGQPLPDMAPRPIGADRPSPSGRGWSKSKTRYKKIHIREIKWNILD